jgi:hypothetical protein
VGAGSLGTPPDLIRATDDVMAIVAVLWAGRCRGGARDGAHASADCRTNTGAAPASGDRANNRAGAGANQATTQRTLGGIVRVGKRAGRHQQASGY